MILLYDWSDLILTRAINYSAFFFSTPLFLLQLFFHRFPWWPCRSATHSDSDGVSSVSYSFWLPGLPSSIRLSSLNLSSFVVLCLRHLILRGRFGLVRQLSRNVFWITHRSPSAWSSFSSSNDLLNVNGKPSSTRTNRTQSWNQIIFASIHRLKLFQHAHATQCSQSIFSSGHGSLRDDIAVASISASTSASGSHFSTSARR